MADTYMPPEMGDGKPMRLAHEIPRMTNAGRSRVEAVLAKSCGCGGETVSITRRPKMGTTVVSIQCNTCGRAIGGELSRFDHPHYELYPDRNGVLPIQWQHEQREHWAEISRQRQEEFEAARPERQAQYAEFLDTPEWRSLRSKVLTRAAFLCECCLNARAEQVHHLTYKQGLLPPAWELRAVCRACHQRIHDAVTP